MTSDDNLYLLHPHSVVGRPTPPVVIDRGQGARVWDVEGTAYIDGTCGLWQCAVGHGRAELAAVAAEQMQRLEFYTSFWDFSNEPSIRLAARLVELAPAGLGKVFFTNGGSEGTETAIKLARLARHATGEPDRTVVLSRTGAYHGVSGTAMAATGIERLKDGFGPQAVDFVHLSTPHGPTHGPAATDKLLVELEEAIETIGAHRITAMIGEPVLGVGGSVPPPEGYWPGVQAILRRHGILLILDETITAFGRTGHWFAAERFGVQPDLIITAKALSSGYVPMGAVLIGDQVIDMLDGTTFFHGFTYNGHPVGAAVALANLDIIEREGLLQRATVLGDRLLDGLVPLADLPHVREVRGCGLMIGITLESNDAPDVVARCRADGVIARGAANTIVLSPPLVITEPEVDTVCEVISRHVRRLGS
ncbi:aspartate aminotransferase family protein [Nocardioides glacieisoli]|uniref:Aspartate aminotransferase family protein n=1 Tax=Nocardioides glacieisoli TaxID=1168730 RepID=A0A4Q2RJ91_9ACTN|nr:aspartate aminotransferase family protein [Nocardioides glacieisoli]